jgi:hypothetical protein
MPVNTGFDPTAVIGWIEISQHGGISVAVQEADSCNIIRMIPHDLILAISISCQARVGRPDRAVWAGPAYQEEMQ